MKIVALLLMVSGFLPLFADDAIAEATREKQIAQLRASLTDPKLSDKERADIATFALTILDQDTSIIAEKNKKIAATQAALDTATTPPPAAATNAPPVQDAPAASGDAPLTTASGKPLKDGLNILSMDARVTDSDEDYDHVAWKGVLYNNGDTPLTNVIVHFYFDDKDDFQLDEGVEVVASIAPHSSFTSSGNIMLKPEIWAKVDRYRVKTD